jgi:hypothetical protein
VFPLARKGDGVRVIPLIPPGLKAEFLVSSPFLRKSSVLRDTHFCANRNLLRNPETHSTTGWGGPATLRRTLREYPDQPREPRQTVVISLLAAEKLGVQSSHL